MTENYHLANNLSQENMDLNLDSQQILHHYKSISDYHPVETEINEIHPPPRSHRQHSQRDIPMNHMRSVSSLHQTPNSFNRTTTTPLNRRDASAHSSMKKTLLTETINKKYAFISYNNIYREEDLLKRLCDLQSLGTNQALVVKNESNKN